MNKSLCCKIGLSVCIFSMFSFSASFAAGRFPEISYSGYKTAVDLKMAIYSGWVSRFGYTGCGFERWSWIENSTYITGIPQSNPICGYGHLYNYYYKTEACAKGYIPDDEGAPSYCFLPDDVVDA